MKTEIRDAWADALESGEYKQGYGQLRTADDKFCALGVLCDLAVKAGALAEPEFMESDESFTGYRYEYSATVPPDDVWNWSGRCRIIPIMSMNDDKHNKFVTIAKWIRENL